MCVPLRNSTNTYMLVPDIKRKQNPAFCKICKSDTNKKRTRTSRGFLQTTGTTCSLEGKGACDYSTVRSQGSIENNIEKGEPHNSSARETSNPMDKFEKSISYCTSFSILVPNSCSAEFYITIRETIKHSKTFSFLGYLPGQLKAPGMKHKSHNCRFQSFS